MRINKKLEGTERGFFYAFFGAPGSEAGGTEQIPDQVRNDVLAAAWSGLLLDSGSVAGVTWRWVCRMRLVLA